MRWSRRYSSAKKRAASGGTSPGWARQACTSWITSPPAQKAFGPLPRSSTQAIFGSVAQAFSLASRASIIGKERALRLFSASRVATPMQAPCWPCSSSKITFIHMTVVGWKTAQRFPPWKELVEKTCGRFPPYELLSPRPFGDGVNHAAHIGIRYLFCHCGSRFSRKALTPSRVSWASNRSTKRSRSSGNQPFGPRSRAP